MSLLNGSPTWMYSAGGDFYSHTIDQSLRFNSADSAYLSRTPSSASNRKTFTLSCWVKRAKLGEQTILDAYSNDQNRTRLMIDAGNRFQVFTRLSNSDHNLICNARSRDTLSWYHVVYSIDTTQSTASNRVKIYINGALQTFTGSNFPDQNEDMFINSNVGHSIGCANDGGGRETFFDGYLSEMHLVDGSALTASSFGETKEGIWIPKEYSGSHGTNGFYLPFDDGSAIGDDESANTNDWTVNNLVASDIMPDSPTNNFATLNPLFNSVSQAVLSEGNLKAATAGFTSSAYGYGATSTFSIPKDKKIYIEVECTDTTGDSWFAGFATKTSIETGVGGNTGSDGSITVYNRSVRVNGTEIDYGSGAGLGGLGVAKLVAGDILGLMIDGATGKMWASRNGTYFKSPTTNDSGTTGDPAGGSHELGTLTGGTTDDVFLVLGGGTGADNIFVNFGQDSVNVSSAETDANGIGSFEYAPPTDYLCLCANNLSSTDGFDPIKGEGPTDHYKSLLWSGDGNNGRSITGVGFDPDWVWIKSRNKSTSHLLNDTLRGANASLFSEGTNAETAGNGGGYLSAFVTDGFSVTSGSSGDDAVNDGTGTYVAWNWKAGGAPTATNAAAAGAVPTSGSVMIDGVASTSALAGSIAATKLSVNTKAGFSIGTFTKGSGTQTVAHGLNTAPNWYVVKRTNGSGSWFVYHSEIASDAETDYMRFNSPNAKSDDATVWGDTAPTNTVFSVAGAFNSGEQLVFYAGHDVEGFSKFGVFSGNSSADGTFVYCGFRPARIWLKRSDSSSVDWTSYDLLREGYNDNNDTLRFVAAIEQSDEDLDILSNGFKMRRNMANNQGTIAFFAWAEQPFKYANAR